MVYKIDRRSPREALEELTRRSWQAIVLDFPAFGWHSTQLFEKIQNISSGSPILIYDPTASPSEAIHLARLGAFQFIGGDDDAVRLLAEAREARSSRELAQLAQRVGREEWEDLLLGDSHEMRQVCHIIRAVGSRRSTVLITGETGTGKERAARALHLAGPRRRGPWVAVNCTALPENLLEAELFGHTKGAFTGAILNRVGRFEEAQGGTIFLDEIGDLAMSLQAKLLRVVQERELQRLGSSETVHLDVRIIAATNCDLQRSVEQGRFREDLFYRLNVVPLQMPPLRCRRADIPGLATHFAAKVCHFEGIPCKSITAEAGALLAGYPWPGNVRQLENAVEMAVAFSGERRVLDVADFALPAAPFLTLVKREETPLFSLPEHGLDYEQTLAVIERSILEQALQKTGGNKKAAADMLGLKRTTLSAKVRTLTAMN